MAKKDKKPEVKNERVDMDQEQASRQVQVKAQYIKDFSFENPAATNGKKLPESAPQINVNVDLNAKKRDETHYELDLVISAKAEVEGNPMFLVEVNYAGVFAFGNMDEKEIQPALMVFCPTLLFPFARQIIANVTRDGGFPPLMLEPIDFARLYVTRMQQAQKEAGEQKAS